MSLLLFGGQAPAPVEVRYVMPIRDPFGSLVTYLRAGSIVTDIAAAANIGSRPTKPPCVVIEDMGASLRPFGRGSGGLGLQLAMYAIKCYGPALDANGKPVDTGPITARQLAGAVAAWLDRRGPIPGTTWIVRGYAPAIEPLLYDPDTRWPYHTVRVQLYAATTAQD